MKSFREFLEERQLNEAKERKVYDTSFNINAKGATERDTLDMMRHNYDVLVATKNSLTQAFSDAPTASRAKDTKDEESVGSANPMRILNRDMQDINKKFIDWYNKDYLDKKRNYDERSTAISTKSKTREELKAKQVSAENIKNELRYGIKKKTDKQETPKENTEEKKDSEEKTDEAPAARIYESIHLPANYHLHRNVKKKVNQELQGVSISSSEQSVQNLQKNLEADFRKRGNKLIEIQSGEIDDILKKINKKLNIAERAVRYIDNPISYFAEIRTLIGSAYAKIVALSSMLTNLINEYDANISSLISRVDNSYDSFNREASGINTDIALGKEERSIVRRERAKELASNIAKRTIASVSDKIKIASAEKQTKKAEKAAEKAGIEAEKKEKTESENKFRNEVRDIIDDRQSDYTKYNAESIKKIAQRILADANKGRKKDRKEINNAEALALYAFFDRMRKNGGKLSERDKRLIGSGDKFVDTMMSKYFDKFKNSNSRSLLKKITTSELPEVAKPTDVGLGASKKEPEKAEGPEKTELTNTERAAKDFEKEPENIFDLAVQKARKYKEQ